MMLFLAINSCWHKNRFFFFLERPNAFFILLVSFHERITSVIIIVDEGQWKNRVIEFPADIAIPWCPSETDCPFSSVPHLPSTSSLQMFLSVLWRECGRKRFLSFDSTTNVQGQLLLNSDMFCTVFGFCCTMMSHLPPTPKLPVVIQYSDAGCTSSPHSSVWMYVLCHVLGTARSANTGCFAQQSDPDRQGLSVAVVSPSCSVQPRICSAHTGGLEWMTS